MKKFIIFNVVLGIGLICAIVAFALNINPLDLDWYLYTTAVEDFGNSKDPDIIRQIDELHSDCVKATVIHVLNGVGMLNIFAVLLTIDIPAIKNYISMTKEQRMQNRAAKAEQRAIHKAAQEQLKADRAEAEKQKRIAELQSKLDELKKDE